MEREFEELYRGYVPNPDDRIENVPFYASYAALKALWPVDEHIIHQCACHASWEPDGARYRAAKATLKHMAATMVEPKLVKRYSYLSEPNPVTDADVEAFIRADYKRAYPDKRWGTKESKTTLERVWDKARQILEARHNEAVKRYRHEIDAIDRENADRQAKYNEAVAKIAALRTFVATH